MPQFCSAHRRKLLKYNHSFHDQANWLPNLTISMKYVHVYPLLVQKWVYFLAEQLTNIQTKFQSDDELPHVEEIFERLKTHLDVPLT